jgi:hypothetical protein
VPSTAHSCSPAAPCTSSVVRTANPATADLWAELKGPHSGEDGCITIEHHRERRRNLDGDFGAVDTTPVRQATHSPTSLAGSRGGYMVLAPYLHMMVWPCKFWLHLPEKYDGSVNSTEFLQIYSTSILAVGGNEAIMANYFSVVLTRMARSWLMNLPEGSLTSWGQLCHQFTTNFDSAYACPGNEVDLHAVQQCGPSSSGSPRFETPSPTSPTLLLLSLFDRA